VKKRTYMQLQFGKSDKMVTEVKDFIVSNMVLNGGGVETIKGEKPEEHELLPN
jgi:hypothetical protein